MQNIHYQIYPYGCNTKTVKNEINSINGCKQCMLYEQNLLKNAFIKECNKNCYMTCPKI